LYLYICIIKWFTLLVQNDVVIIVDAFMADVPAHQILTHSARLMVYALDEIAIKTCLRRFSMIIKPAIDDGIDAFMVQIVKTPRVGDAFKANGLVIKDILAKHLSALLMSWNMDDHQLRNDATVDLLRDTGADMRALYAVSSHIFASISKRAVPRFGVGSAAIMADLATLQRILAFDAATALASSQSESMRASQERTGLIMDEVEKFRIGASQLASDLTEASAAVNHSVDAVQEAAHSALSKSSRAAEASEQGNNNLTASATSTEELSMATKELARRSQSARAAVSEAEGAVTAARGSISDLQAAADKIGSIVGLISSIAEQTNLLALNATIEAARAGDAGRGFAVVAQEVKALASQTTKATQDIIAQIAAVQLGTAKSVTEIGLIGSAMDTLSHNASEVASAVEQQHALTGELSRSLHETVVEVMAAGEGYEGAAQLMQTANLNIGTLRSTVERMRDISNGLGRGVETFAAAVKSA
jgi:methyl-accepting chemotaxis protein